MSRVFTLQRFRTFTPEIHLVLMGTFFVRMAYFMVWPFLAVILYRNFQLSATTIGLMLTCASLLGAAAGLLSGYYSDRTGRRRVILAGCALGALAFFALAAAGHPVTYLLAIAGVSVGNALLESTSKALIGDKIADRKDRELAFYVRYFMINAGAAVGALIGVWVGLSGKQWAFGVTGGVYVAYWLMLVAWLRDGTPRAAQAQRVKPGFGQACAQVFMDRVFLMLLLSNIAMAFVYANFDSTLVQYLTRSHAPQLMAMISTLVAVNAATVIFGQFPILRLMESLPPRQRIVIGVLLMCVSQALFAVSPVTSLIGFVLATFVLSVGELIAFPTFSVEVDRNTPDHLRGTYFGASNLYSLGTAIAPLLGGLSLDIFGGRPLYLGLAVLCAVVAHLNRDTVASASLRGAGKGQE
ncbi:MDR family MFS transporter [Burkholderia plantarii]|uniref:Putative major facilitator superfamily MFS-1 transporter n=1 Tax=Burkholderia plantarii TaxID=41899 RepID=A0A0B6S7F5_BURPL|nr:MFS transporter [Burkholderia plantarii]AJK48186.1 putative major facilitator superfamily MFS-1 transporter [Burkholderia plantarii]ALK32375.1 major facilitator superfamily transporter [Burkholderia plantarii]GLZ18917.1 MFS transporter [Burkholderia plantarii]